MRALRPVRFPQFIPAILGLWLGLAVLAPAAEASLSQSYAATGEVPIGSLVALDAKTAGTVVIADPTNESRLFGIAVSPSAASISLGTNATSGQVQVATSGAVSGLVTNTAGDIHVGDPIAVSAIAGVGEKATGRVRVIGTAQADFNAATEGTTKRSIDTDQGKKEVVIGQIPILIAVATLNAEGTSNAVLPSWLQSLSNSIAGKAVNPIRIIIAGLLLLIAMITVAVLLYAAVRNSIISIGRNPLSRGSVLRGLMQVVAISAVILAVTVIAMYLVIAK